MNTVGVGVDKPSLVFSVIVELSGSNGEVAGI